MSITSKLFDLTGKVVWVVGGAGYLCSPACRELAAHGATVIVADLRLAVAEQLATSIRSAGGKAQATELNVTDEAAVSSAADEIIVQFGRMDVMVNATWFYRAKLIEEMTLADWREGMQVNLDAAFVLSREAGKRMLAQGGGSIIQFSSMYGVVSPDPGVYEPPTLPNPPHYGAAKAGVLQLTRYEAVRWGGKGVRVNAIIPGPFPVLPPANADAEKLVATLSRKVPMGRVGRQEEIAGAVVYLASDASSFVNGTSITIDGGWTAW